MLCRNYQQDSYWRITLLVVHWALENLKFTSMFTPVTPAVYFQACSICLVTKMLRWFKLTREIDLCCPGMQVSGKRDEGYIFLKERKQVKDSGCQKQNLTWTLEYCAFHTTKLKSRSFGLYQGQCCIVVACICLSERVCVCVRLLCVFVSVNHQLVRAWWLNFIF